MLEKVQRSMILFVKIALTLALLLTTATYCVAAGDDSTDNNATGDFQQNTENVFIESNIGEISRDENLAVDSSDTVLCFDEHPAFSQKDLNDNFLHYTDGDSRADLPRPYSTEDAANVVGVVLDKDTSQPISNATIFVDETALVCTGDDGRFQIKNLSNGTYEWRVAATGYNDSRYLNYSVNWADGTDIFTFYLSDSTSIIKDAISIKHRSTYITDQALNYSEPEVATTALYQTPPAYSTVSVKGHGTKINRQQYVYTVLGSETYNEAFYLNPTTKRPKALTSAQLNNFLLAQAYAINTYVEYTQRVFSNHRNEGYDVCDNDHCQVYDPTKVLQRNIQVTAQLFSSAGTMQLYFHLLPVSGFEYMCSSFFSSCYNQGTLTDPNQPTILVSTSCSDFDVGYGGHRKGLCQMGAAELARNNYTGPSIMSYYYTDVVCLNCKLTART